jgi:hypothetical protein
VINAFERRSEVWTNRKLLAWEISAKNNISKLLHHKAMLQTASKSGFKITPEHSPNLLERIMEEFARGWSGESPEVDHHPFGGLSPCLASVATLGNSQFGARWRFETTSYLIASSGI